MTELPAYIQALIVGDLTPPSDVELAHLLALIGDERASSLRTLLWLIHRCPEADGQTAGLWQRAVDATTDREGASGMLAALDVEADLEQLKTALQSEGVGWQSPAEILDPGLERGVDVEPILSLAQKRFIASQGQDQDLQQVIVRLLQHLAIVQKRPELDLDSPS